MKTRKTSIIFALIMSLLIVISMSSGVCAESEKKDGSGSFDGKKITSDFKTGEIAKAIDNLQPGDDFTFTVTYTNKYKEDTDWYMENEVLKTLEKTAEARKNRNVTGNSDAENGGYTYELWHYDKNGKRDKNALFSSEKVGGEAKPAKMEGLEQATNALDDWFYIDTLGKGETAKVVLKVAFEGETEVNDYMDTEGAVNLRFAVEIHEPNTPPNRTVKTGDQSDMLRWAVIAIVAALLLLIVAFFSYKRDKKDRKGGRA